MVDAMGWIVKAIPEDIPPDFGKYSHWGIIHTTWGVCKLLIPALLDEEVIVQICMFGTAKPEEVVFRGHRTEDVEAFVEMVEQRLTNAVVKHAFFEMQQHLADGGRLQ
jgi:hypothetical protein